MLQGLRKKEREKIIFNGVKKSLLDDNKILFRVIRSTT